MNDESITPSLDASDIYQGSNKEFEATPPGTYRMALAGELKVKSTKAGEKKLEAFLKHVETPAKSTFRGVNLSVMLEGVDKNGKPKAKQFGDFLAALGVAVDDIAGGAASVELTGSAPEGAEWKGAPAAVKIKGDRIDLTGREVLVKVEASTFNGKTTTKATGVYKVRNA